MLSLAERLKEGREQKGYIVNAQDIVINGLEAKFCKVPSEILDKIKNLNDRENFRNLHRMLIKTDNI